MAGGLGDSEEMNFNYIPDLELSEKKCRTCGKDFLRRKGDTREVCLQCDRLAVEKAAVGK
jgi:hypothetical protein